MVEGRANLIVLAPNAAECAEPGWLEAAVRVLERELVAGGVGYALVPRRWRWQVRGLLRQSTLRDEGFVAHLPSADANPQYVVPLQRDLLRHMLLRLTPTRRWRRAGVLAAMRVPLGEEALARGLPSAGLVVRRAPALPLSHWLANAPGARPARGITAVSWEEGSTTAVVHGFPEGAATPRSVAKLSLSWPALIDRADEAAALRQLTPAAAAAGCAVPGVIRMGQLGGQNVLFESALSGRPFHVLLADAPRRWGELVALAAGWLRRWNQITRRRERLPLGWLQEQTVVPARRLEAHLAEAAEYCRWLDQLCSAVAAQEVPVVASHNDLSARNLLLGGSQLGVVDWEMARDRDLPLIDFFYMVTDLTAASLGYRGWLEASRSAFGVGGRHAARAAALQAESRRSMGISDEVAQLGLHACWLRRAVRDYGRAPAEQWRPFLDIVRWLWAMEARSDG